jgi:DNA-binding NarL/FixJ family response regulator
VAVLDLEEDMNYLASAMDRLGALNRIQAIRIASEKDWL